MTLLNHLRSLNAETRAWVAAGENRWACEITEDLAHWAGMGVTTVAEFQRYQNEVSYWDLYKDVFGVRPRGVRMSEMTDSDLGDEIDSLVAMLDIDEVDDLGFDDADFAVTDWMLDDADVAVAEFQVETDWFAGAV